jgi:flagellum-specific peptidoglycan hydrolase FlgJ
MLVEFTSMSGCTKRFVDDCKDVLVEDSFRDSPEDSEGDRKLKKYIRRFKKVAIAEMKRTKIPASVKMAQGILESGVGTSDLAVNNNNHFGVRCFKKRCKKSRCTNPGHGKDSIAYRKYAHAIDSWVDHSKVLLNDRYSSLWGYGSNYLMWARGLYELGYAFDPDYEKLIVKIIEDNRLYLLDQHVDTSTIRA